MFASSRKRARNPTGGGGSAVAEMRKALGPESSEGDGRWGIWVNLPEDVRPSMVDLEGLAKELTQDFVSGTVLPASADPRRIESLHNLLGKIQSLRNGAEDSFDAAAGRRPETDRPADKEAERMKESIMFAFDRVQEMAYARLLACQSASLVKDSRDAFNAFLTKTQAALDAGGAEEEERDEKAALPSFLRGERLGNIQRGTAEEANKFVDLLLYVQFSLRSRGLRRYGDRVYSRTFNSEGKKTVAWSDAGEISKFIYRVCRKNVNPRMWAIIAQPSDPVSSLVKYFQNSDDPEFPALVRDKSVFSFDNGVYMAATNKFFEYPLEDPEHPLNSGSTVPAKHFETRFPVGEWEKTKAGKGEYWKEIPTPIVDGIFSYQEIDREAIDMMYVTSGRLLHDVGRMDNYGYVGMIAGAAGTGKSTFCMHLTKMWESEDVGVLSNNCERQFALYPFMDKFLFVAPEVKSDFKLDQAEWQGITTGDPMSCAVKFKAARAVKWTTPGFFCGNQIPDWVDHGGSVLRRLLIWKFNKRVKDENGELPRQLEDEIPKFILKCAVAYLHTLELHSTAGLWNWVPQYFWDQRRALTAQLNPLESFIHEKVLKDPDELVPFDEFKRSLRDYCKENGFETYRMSGDTFTTIFSDHGFAVGEREYRGHTSQPRLIKCVTGCRLRTENDNVAAAATAAAAAAVPVPSPAPPGAPALMDEHAMPEDELDES